MCVPSILPQVVTRTLVCVCVCVLVPNLVVLLQFYTPLSSRDFVDSVFTLFSTSNAQFCWLTLTVHSQYIHSTLVYIRVLYNLWH